MQSESHFAVNLMRHMVTPTFVLDASGHVVLWNRACERLTGVMADQVLRTRDHWRAFYDRERATLADVFLQRAHHLLADGYEAFYIEPGSEEGAIRAENWVPMPFSNEMRYLAIEVGPVFDEQCELIAVVETMHDMTELKRSQDALRQTTIADALTGLGNRRHFDHQYEAVWQRCRRYQHPLSLLLIDIDQYATYGATLGKPAEQALLAEIARLLRACTLRPDDECFRYHAGLFAVLLPDTAARGAMGVAERIRQQVYDFAIDYPGSSQGRVTACVGVASVLPNSESETAVIFNKANAALYEAKEKGYNSVGQWYAYELSPVFTNR